MPLGVDIPVKEVQRYMGYRGLTEISPDVQEKISKAIDMVSTQSHPRIVTKEYPVRVRGNDITIYNDTEEIVLTSEALARNLKGCCGAILLAATIGPACDMLVRRASVLPLQTLPSIRQQVQRLSRRFLTIRTQSSKRNTRHRAFS